MSSVLGVIPARYASKRFPGKPLALIKGKPMVQWVYETARRALGNAVVATDDRRIADKVRSFGGQAMMTPKSCASGTDRMAYVAAKKKADFYVNIQGDEPLMRAATIRAALSVAKKSKAIGTCATALASADHSNPNAVKVVLDRTGRALYFSRSMVPFPRDKKTHSKPLKHLGIYAYPRAQLMRFVKLKPSPLEKTEMLEQLRALYYGWPIYVAYTPHTSIGVDTPNDLKQVNHLLRKESRT